MSFVEAVTLTARGVKLVPLALFIGVGETFQIWNPTTFLEDPRVPEDMKDIARFRIEERGVGA